MEFLLLVVGAILGIVADIFLRQPILRLVFKLKRFLARILHDYSPDDRPYQLRFGVVAVDWVSILGTGEIPFKTSHLRADFINEFVKLPIDLDTLRKEAERFLEEKAITQASNVWNEKRFALIGYYPTRFGETEEPGICFQFRLTDYATFYGVTLKLDVPGLVKDAAGNPCSIRDKYYPQFTPETPNHFLTHSFGINLLVITTRDNKAIFAQRSTFVADYKKYFHISMNEGMQYPQDIDEAGHPSFVKTAVRGLYEELGLNLGELGIDSHCIEFLNFGAAPSKNQYALLGRVKIPLSAKDVERIYFDFAKDRGLETRHALFAVDYLPDEILTFVRSCRPWTYVGIATLYYSMVREWGYWEVKNFLSRHTLKEDIFKE